MYHQYYVIFLTPATETSRLIAPNLHSGSIVSQIQEYSFLNVDFNLYLKRVTGIKGTQK